MIFAKAAKLHASSLDQERSLFARQHELRRVTGARVARFGPYQTGKQRGFDSTHRPPNFWNHQKFLRFAPCQPKEGLTITRRRGPHGSRLFFAVCDIVLRSRDDRQISYKMQSPAGCPASRRQGPSSRQIGSDCRSMPWCHETRQRAPLLVIDGKLKIGIN
jgi:hypothetical protein